MSVTVTWWDLGHRTWFGVCAYLQAGPDLQGGTGVNRGLALTCLPTDAYNPLNPESYMRHSVSMRLQHAIIKLYWLQLIVTLHEMAL